MTKPFRSGLISVAQRLLSLAVSALSCSHWTRTPVDAGIEAVAIEMPQHLLSLLGSAAAVKVKVCQLAQPYVAAAAAASTAGCITDAYTVCNAGLAIV